MKFIDPTSGEIVEALVEVDGRQVPLDERYHPDFIAGLLPYDPANPPAAPAPPPTPVPASVSRFQARAALYQAGNLEEVEAIMAQPATPMLTKLAWQDAQTFERSSATVAALAGALALSDADLDALFFAAAAITA